ncbi:MAG: VWA domain-containing protein [Gammaproteobacteria bacterium]|nr:VWA domain-containing protein [Gammaproteobacteria bacterium]MBU1724770.1 VWA domain-containing protein [Gammaproteobacteria bacterium]MBU2005777.1 VWA domain-containing protein [Gammaproteobacteria bacterium]
MNIDWLTPYLALIPVVLLLASTPLRLRSVQALSQRSRARSLSGVEGNSAGGIFLHPLAHLLPTTKIPQWQCHLQRAIFAWFWLCLTLAIAQPVRLGERLPDLPPERDIVLLVDVSISMTLTDYEVAGQRRSRMEVLKTLLHDFAGHLQGERLGVIVFAETPHLLVPLTRDPALVQAQLARLSPTLAGRVSAVGDALTLALKEAGKRPQRKQVFVLFTDADESIGRVEPEAAAELTAEAGIPLYTIAIGSTAASMEGDTGGLVYQPVNLALLQTLSQRTGGQTFQAGDAQAVRQALEAITRQQQNTAEQAPRYEQQPLYPWLLLAGLLPLMLWQVWQRREGV